MITWENHEQYVPADSMMKVIYYYSSRFKEDFYYFEFYVVKFTLEVRRLHVLLCVEVKEHFIIGGDICYSFSILESDKSGICGELLMKQEIESIDMEQSGKFILDGLTFILDDCSNTRLYIFESDEYEGTISIEFDVWFQKERYQNKMVSPSICIHSHETGKANVEEIIGCTYHVEDVKESDKREDTLYIFEHEPMEKYSFTIIEILNQMG